MFLQDLQLSCCKMRVETGCWQFLLQISSQNRLQVRTVGLSSFSFTEVTICALSLGFCSRSDLYIETTITGVKTSHS